MSKRSSDSALDDEEDAKRFCADESALDGPTTLVIQDGEEGNTIIQENTILADGTIIQNSGGMHDGTELTLQEGIEEGHMTIHIAEGAMGDVVVGDPLEQQHVTIVSDIDQELHEEHDAQTLTLSEAIQAGEEIEQIEQQQQEEDDDLYQNIIVQHMDIEEPLSMLRKLLEARLQCTLADHDFYLQDAIPLDPNKNLVSQCVQGTGMVQINVEVKSQPGVKPRLNIVDILKPAEEVLEMDTLPAPAPTQSTTPSQPSTTKVVIPFPEESENVTRWIVDQNFRKEQERLKIPFDPSAWNSAHVRHWMQWAIKEFKLTNVLLGNFDHMNGKDLCEMKHDDFTKYIPSDVNDIFWTHLELLRKCKFVAVIQQPTPHAITTITVSTTDQAAALEGGLVMGRTGKSYNRRPRSITIPSERLTSGNRTGNNGQIQLWQFLLDLLTDKDYREIIHWIGDEGEFKLHNPEMVAQLWGQRKNKPTMNYEKLSRALRYYYDGDMIAKVHGKRFVYKFVCDLRMLLGYTAAELNKLVRDSSEAARITKIRETGTSRPAILRKIEVQ